MNLRERYLEWHKKNINAHDMDFTDFAELFNQALQFCDEFIGQCDKLEKKVNDKSRVVRNLCKEIVLLKQELDQYRWRDVNEELPEFDTEVLVTLKTGYQTVGWREKDSDDSWWSVYGPDYYEVTHWMPMPEFKQKGSGDE